ncbi:MAG TPA: hypothetical protein VI728_10070 [Syntrophales bacterium]|nr:hypothetical protein [Syntrophales bacterium]
MADSHNILVGPSLPVRAVDVVPHRGTMLLIDELCECSSEHAVGRTTVTSRNPFVDAGGRLEGVCFVELLAQLAAASRGHDMLKTSGTVKNGFLTGVRNFIIHKQASLGDLLYLRFKKTLEMDIVTVIEGGIFRDDECLASGRLNLHITGDEPSAQSLRLDNGNTGQDCRLLNPEHRSKIFSGIRKSLNKLEISGENGSAYGEFRFDNSFPGFDGHFPGFAILPGVVMIDLSVALCEDLLKCRLLLTGIEMAKFTNPILPGDLVEAEVSAVEKNGVYTVRGRLISGSKIAATLLLLARRDENDQ